MYPESAKMKKQMAYADKRNIPFVVLIGESECEKESFHSEKYEDWRAKRIFHNTSGKEIFL
ncbi:hypothetical protein CCAN11_2380033 [Capnocytophaga canimorsus]|uniref:Anticodon-binding domain-containing protein n=1 Tax=Capnocytophaga canimorsus TaxID=28188 RepID=A0A0B7IN30_9FLAO|nr:hypothetical protein CCAN11_2380033 [Capnocytophaga canimorsus]